MPDAARLPDPEVPRARLDTLRARRGFLLPHHGALAAAAPMNASPRRSAT